MEIRTDALGEPTTTSVVTLPLTDDSGRGYLVDVELAPVEGHIGCVGLRVRGYAVDGLERMDHRDLALPPSSAPDREITSSLLRKVKVAHLRQQAIAQRKRQLEAKGDLRAHPESFEDWVRMFGFEALLQEDPDTRDSRLKVLKEQYELETLFLEHEARIDDWIENLPADAPKPVRTPRIPDTELRHVAEIYVRALADGDRAPAKAVARELQMSHGKARRRVMYARSRGFLPPTTRGQARGAEPETRDEG